MDLTVKTLDQIDVEVGVRIRFRRKFLAMSQTSLATALGITFQQVQNYEKGLSRVSASRLQAIAFTLQVPVSYFFASREIPYSHFQDDFSLAKYLTTADGLNLNQAFPLIKDAAVRQCILELVEALTERE